jgi:hypothetical protein
MDLEWTLKDLQARSHAVFSQFLIAAFRCKAIVQWRVDDGVFRTALKYLSTEEHDIFMGTEVSDSVLVVLA